MKKTKFYFIWICNLVDTVATLSLYETGLFEELNPFMAYLLQTPFLFGVVKISVITIILLRLWQVREEKKAKIAINIGCWIYGFIALYYVFIFAWFY